MPELLQPITNGDGATSIFVKPVGGLWTSTWNAKQKTSEWVEWCRDNDFGNPDNYLWHLLTPSSEVRIAVIDSFADLMALLKSYPRPMPSVLAFWEQHYLDFEKMSQDYDAVHLTVRGQRQTHLSYPGLYGWDCESCLWFRWMFTKVRQISVQKAVEEEVA